MSVNLGPLAGDSLESVLSGKTPEHRLHRTTHAADQALSKLNRPTAPVSADQEVSDQRAQLLTKKLGTPLFRSIVVAPPEPTGRSPGPEASRPAEPLEAEPERQPTTGLLVDVFG